MRHVKLFVLALVLACLAPAAQSSGRVSIPIAPARMAPGFRSGSQNSPGTNRVSAAPPAPAAPVASTTTTTAASGPPATRARTAHDDYLHSIAPQLESTVIPLKD